MMKIFQLAGLACLMALTSALSPESAAAQEFSGEIELLELHTDLDEENLAVDAAFELREGTRGVVLKLEGNGDIGPTMDELEAQALFLQEVGRSTTLLVGIRHDFRSGSNLSHATVAAMHDFAGWLSGEAFSYLSEDGDLTGTGELVASIPVAEGLDLEPRLGLLWSAQDISREGFGAGLAEMTAEARLRKVIAEGLDAYIGIVHARLLSDTRRLARAAGDSLQSTSGAVGLGITF